MVFEKKICKGCGEVIIGAVSERREYHDSTCRTRAWQARGKRRPKDDFVDAVLKAAMEYEERVRG
jgi:hypothetical protein